MKLARFFTSIALAITLVVPQSFVFAAETKIFSDLSTTHRNYFAIKYLKDNSMVAGYPDGTFGPESTINRAEFVLMLYRVLWGDAPIPERYKNCFPDVKEEWFAPAVCYGKERGWVAGYPDGYYRPENHVNEAESLVILVNALKFVPKGQAYWDFDLPASERDQWYTTALSYSTQFGLYDGDAKTVQPGAKLTRAKAAEHFYRGHRLTRGGGINMKQWYGETIKAVHFGNFLAPFNDAQYAQAVVVYDKNTEPIDTSVFGAKLSAVYKHCDPSVTDNTYMCVNQSDELGGDTEILIKMKSGLLKVVETDSQGTITKYDVPEVYMAMHDSANYFKYNEPSILPLPDGSEVRVRDGIQSFQFFGEEKYTSEVLGEVDVAQILTSKTYYGIVYTNGQEIGPIEIDFNTFGLYAKDVGLVHSYTTLSMRPDGAVGPGPTVLDITTELIEMPTAN